ncbi:hypothetical protein GGR57DRAFT_517417 [Xylariaceae sp. FL1272]|nr:hypothetical protein GGR57DRAFT_517417 [Xylariaceae sp. FL1272]
MVDYSDQNKEWTFEETVSRTWARSCGSSVWLEKLNVYLAVSRIIFYTKGVKQWPEISFLRGQIYDEDWQEIRNHTVHWGNNNVTFPTIFKVEAPYEQGGCFYGPEDPRIIVEEGVPDAEPVIVFNMLTDTHEKTRKMHILRPFSGYFKRLSISWEGADTQKNWAPFFYDTTGLSRRRLPSQYIYFGYDFNNFRILRCHLEAGFCHMVYEQRVTEEQSQRHNHGRARTSGGTNLVPVPLGRNAVSGSTAYVGFPRTHVDGSCRSGATYRPELMVIVVSGGGMYFHLQYLSDQIDFGDMVLTTKARFDPCGDGRILIANSVARWEIERNGADVMTLTVSVADSTVQVLRIRGVLGYVNGLLQSSRSWGVGMGNEDGDGWNERWTNGGRDALGCSLEASQNESIAASDALRGYKLADFLLDEGRKEE